MEFDLNIMYSFSTKNPTRENCVQEISNMPRFIPLKESLDDNGELKAKNYEHKFVYILFESQSGCALTLTSRGMTHQMKKSLRQSKSHVAV